MATQSDDFNRASLGANGPNGNAWQGLGTWAIATSTVLQAPVTAQSNTLVYNTTFADVFIEADVLDGPSSSYSGLCFRWTDGDNYFSAQWATSGGNITIVKREATVETTDADLGAPDSGTASSSFNNTATRHGFWHFGNAVTGGTFDNWLLDSDVTIAVSDTDSATFTEGGADIGLESSDSFTFTETAGTAIERSGGRAIADMFRVTESELVAVSGTDPLLARPLYALIETPPLTATIIDYLEQIEDSDWRESGIDIDI